MPVTLPRPCRPGTSVTWTSPPAGAKRAGRWPGAGTASGGRTSLWSSSSPVIAAAASPPNCGRLQRDLEADGYFVVYVEAESDIDLEDTEPPDVLLALIRNLDHALRDAGIDVGEKLLEDFLLWFAEVVLEKTEHTAIEAEVRSEAEVRGGVPVFARLMARLSGWIKTGTESKKQVRQRLDPQISQLLHRGGLFVQAARLAIRKAGKKDLVLIVDSLDRVALKDLGDGRTSQEVLFIERGDLLKGFNCHQVVTVPISLLFSPKAENLAAIFPDRHLLPMVKIAERRTRDPWTVGRDLLVRLLGSRVDLASGFEEEALEPLIDEPGREARRVPLEVRDEETVKKRSPGSGPLRRSE